MAESDDGLGCFGLLLLGAGVYFAFSNYSWSNSLWYSVQYGVGFSDVHTQAKPSDCDFISAPLGAKGCSYTAKVKVYNADGLLVAGENAPKPPKLGSDTKTGKPIISYDDGKSWDWYSGGATTLNLTPKSVTVYWVKE